MCSLCVPLSEVSNYISGDNLKLKKDGMDKLMMPLGKQMKM